jgi:CubicO group peptidase (beta-lactamase class C family)
MQLAIIVSIGLGLCILPLTISAEVDQSKVDKIFVDYAKVTSPGCSVAVIKNGDFVYRKAYGMASLELGVPLSSHAVFYMGSISKQFTAASIVLAAEQGALALDDDVRKYIPELPDYEHPITLRQMLHHTSGLRDFLTLLYLSGRQDSGFHADEVLDLIVKQQRLNNIPGDEFIYSNTNYFLLGEVVKRATGKSLAEFTAEYIFQPLGMIHTRFADDRTAVIPDRVPAYDPGSGDGFFLNWSTTFDIVGAGGLMSSVDDLLLWDRNFYQNKLGMGTLLKELQTPGVLNNGKQIGYALGLELGTYEGLATVEHNGALFGYRTEFVRFPERNLSVLCLCNLSSAQVGRLSRQVADVYIKENLETRSPQPSEADFFPSVARFAGKYRDPRTHTIYSFTVSDGNLSGWGELLKRVSSNSFMDTSNGTITFENSRGTLKVSLKMGDATLFAASKIAEVQLSNIALSAFAGTYDSGEIKTAYLLSIDRNYLTLHNGWNPPIKLVPIGPNEFEGGDVGTVVFYRDLNNRVSGLSVFAGSARDIRFKKIK